MLGLKIERHFTKPGESPYDLFRYERRDSVIRNPDGSIVFEIKNIEVPAQWSQLATDILAQKYFRKAGVPQQDEHGNAKKGVDGKQLLGSETSIRQVVHRLAGCWRHWGEKYGYFSSEQDALAFYDEVAYMLLSQMAAPNSPQWFNTGLAWAYDIRGTPQGHYYADPVSGEVKLSEDAYSRPQPHACFIQSVKDDLVNPGGIFDLAIREARVFKYGSGTGSNFSTLRGKGECLSGGGTSSGLMSFLKLFDAGAGAIKSGGTTRRAAKMVCLDMDHPEIETFIMWKYREEQKVADLVAGSRITKMALQAVMDAAKAGTDWHQNKELKAAIAKAKLLGVPLNYVFRVIQLVKQGKTDVDFLEFDTHYESEAYQTVAGQHANNSVRIPNEFLKAVEEDKEWNLIKRTDGKVWKSLKATELWEKVCLAAWHSADPGVQYDTTINEWHTCPEDGRIVASNPCSEYMFLDDTACNLASLNIVKFLDEKSGEFDIPAFRHATRLMTIMLEISVLMAQFVSEEMARRSYRFRPLGLGYANIGSALMRLGIPYDSDNARGFIGAVSAIMTGQSYATSAEMAEALGPFDGYTKNKAEMLRVIRNHRRAAYNSPPKEYEKLTTTPVGIDPKHTPKNLLEAAKACWDEALTLGEQHGYRNAQVTVLAPTGTIGLLMDCDTTGIEPDFALVKFKKLAGGGYFKIINQSVPPALQRLGYDAKQIDEIIKYAVGHGTLRGMTKGLTHDALKNKGFTDEMLAVVEKHLPAAFDITFVFNRFTLGDTTMERLGFTKAEYEKPEFNLLLRLGFTKEEIEAANEHVCGTMTVEEAPGLKPEHLPVFDCASRCGRKGKRFLQYQAHIKAMAAAQPFITGAISKTINMPNEATIKDISDAYLMSWKLMLKANALYRDGSKLSQPLNTISEDLSHFGEEDVDETVTPELVQHGIAARHSGTPEWEGIARSATIGGKPIEVLTAEYKDGSLGSITIAMEEESEEYRGLLNAYSELLSMSIQHGVPLSELVEKFTFTEFAPSGPVQNDPAIRFVSSPVDYVYRVLGHEYLGRQDLVHLKEVAPTRKARTDAAPKKKATKVLTEEEKLIAKARAEGYTGDKCPACKSMRLKRNGTCALCEDCGTTTGCS